MHSKEKGPNRQELRANKIKIWPLPDPYYSKLTTQELKRRLERVELCRQRRLSWPTQRNDEALRIHKHKIMDKDGPRIEAWSEPCHVNRQKLRKYEDAKQRIERELARRQPVPAPNENAANSERNQSESFEHSEDYRTVAIHGKQFKLTSHQAQMIEILHVSYVCREPEISIHRILEQLGVSTSRWQDTFRSNREAKKALIKSGSRRGTLRLNL